MKKRILFLIIAVIIIIFSGCNKNYKNIKGYEAYISDRDNGYGWSEHFCVSPVKGKENQKDAKLYYKENVRRCGDYLITDYENGICINRYYGNNPELNIPETLENKPVIKIGSYYKNNKENDYALCGAFSKVKNGVLNLSANIKYVTAEAIKDDFGIHIVKINADKNNPYYLSKDGTLYLRDDDSLNLIFINLQNKKEFTVKEPVWLFQPCNGIPADWEGHISFDSDIYDFSTYVADSNGNELEGHSKIKPKFTMDEYGSTEFELFAKKYKIKTIPYK